MVNCGQDIPGIGHADCQDAGGVVAAAAGLDVHAAAAGSGVHQVVVNAGEIAGVNLVVNIVDDDIHLDGIFDLLADGLHKLVHAAKSRAGRRFAGQPVCR